MKQFLTISLLLSCFCTIGQTDSAFRNYDSFRIKYVYDPFFYMETLVGRMICDSGGTNCRDDTEGYFQNRHYTATISVYKGKSQIGLSFIGTYVPAGCFEDVPKDEVLKAQQLRAIDSIPGKTYNMPVDSFLNNGISLITGDQGDVLSGSVSGYRIDSITIDWHKVPRFYKHRPKNPKAGDMVEIQPHHLELYDGNNWIKLNEQP